MEEYKCWRGDNIPISSIIRTNGGKKTMITVRQADDDWIITIKNEKWKFQNKEQLFSLLDDLLANKVEIKNIIPPGSVIKCYYLELNTEVKNSFAETTALVHKILNYKFRCGQLR